MLSTWCWLTAETHAEWVILVNVCIVSTFTPCLCFSIFALLLNNSNRVLSSFVRNTWVQI